MPRLNLLRYPIHNLLWLPLLVLMALTPVSSKAINLAWIYLVVLVVWLFADCARRTPIARDLRGLRPALQILMIFFTAGLCLRVGMILFWSEPVRGFAFELTAAASVAVAWIVARCWQSRNLNLSVWATGFLIASALALLQGYGYTYAAHSGPTNAVNWGAGIALFMCLTLATCAHKQARSRDTLLCVLGLVFFSLAIFVSGRRGAFFAILWVVVSGCFLWLRHIRNVEHSSVRWWMPALALVGVLAITLAAKDRLATPINRVISTVEEISLRLGGAPGEGVVPKGTLGGRLHMLELGWTAGSASPVIGLGGAERSRLIARAEVELQEPLFHLHSEYLHAWVGYGIPGLIGSLCFPLGLIMAGARLRRDAQSLALALTGLGLVHLVSGLTNVNTIHNYYGTVFAVSVVIPFLMHRSVTTETDLPLT